MPLRSHSTLYQLLIIIIILNIFDMALTLNWCRAVGIEIEANPILYKLLSINTVVAVAFKTITILLFTGLMIFASRFNYRLARKGAMLVTVVYLLVLGWHLAPFLFQSLPALPAANLINCK